MSAPAVARRTLQRQQRGETRERIVAAAESILRTRRVRDLSVEDVMETAGLTRTIFYRHFDDLFDLVVTVAAGTFDAMYTHQAELLAEDPPRPQALREAIHMAVAAFAEHGPLIRAVVEGAALDEEVERAYASAIDRFAELTAAFLEREGAVADPDETARALTFLNVNYLLDAFGRGDRVPVAVAERTLVEAWEAVTAK